MSTSHQLKQSVSLFCTSSAIHQFFLRHTILLVSVLFSLSFVIIFRYSNLLSNRQIYSIGEPWAPFSFHIYLSGIWSFIVCMLIRLAFCLSLSLAFICIHFESISAWVHSVNFINVNVRESRWFFTFFIYLFISFVVALLRCFVYSLHFTQLLNCYD